MLVLSRRLGESIKVGDNITVTVVEIRGDTVRIGIETPDDTTAQSGEMLARMEGSQIITRPNSKDSQLARENGG